MRNCKPGPAKRDKRRRAASIRQPFGYGIVGGLLLSQLLTLYTTPVVYLYLDRFRLWIATRRTNPAAHADATALPAE